jgi:tRNA pseudouridine55 synthase
MNSALPPLNGLLLVDKPAGMSSAAVVGKIKWHLRQAGAPKNVKVGHGGTLDPFATGLLPIGVGRGTKALEGLLKGDKAYHFTLQFGTATATQDYLGQPIATSAVRPTLAQIEAILPQLTGPMMQTPPAFSALKVGGKRAYALARAGEVVELAPRTITIHSLQCLDYDGENANFCAQVSKGTYIRTLGADMAAALGTVGHLTTLRRTQHGAFGLHQALALPQMLETLDNALKNRQTPACLYPLPAPAAV